MVVHRGYRRGPFVHPVLGPLGFPSGRGRPFRGGRRNPSPGKGPADVFRGRAAGPPFIVGPMEEASRFESLVNLGAANLAAEEAQRTLREAVSRARKSGATWADIGAALGVTKQTAWEKWRGVDPTPPAVPHVPRYVAPSRRLG